MPSSCAVFGGNNRKSGVNRHLRFFPFPENLEMCMCGCRSVTIVTNCTTVTFLLPHMAHFRVFWKWKNLRCLFTPDLRLLPPNTAQDKGISTDIQTQHRRSHQYLIDSDVITGLFCRIAESSHLSFIH